MNKPIILVTGATGKTGAPVVRQLLEHGYPVRAFVHKIDDRSQRLSELGAETDVVETISGQPPESLANFIQRNIEIFSDEGAAVGAAAH